MQTAAYYDKLNEWYNYLFEGSLESDFRQYGQMEKQRWEQSEKRREEKRREEKKKEERRSEKRKSQGARRGRKVAKHCVFPMIYGSEGRKVGSLKRRVRSHLDRWEMKICTPLWHEAHFQAKIYKTHQLRTTFGSCDVQKVHAVVARSTFPSQNVQSTPA